MKTNLIVSDRGQITLPSEMREKYGMGEGSVLVMEDRDGEIVLKPTSAIDLYSDDQIKEWSAADAFASKTERKVMHEQLKALSTRKDRDPNGE